MLLTPTMPRSAAVDNVAPIHQVYVTHCLYGEGLDRKAGFGPRAGSVQDTFLLRFAAEYPAYELPVTPAANGRVSAATPRRLALLRIPGGRNALIHSVYLPDESRGRKNNFFSHALFSPAIAATRALRTWASPDWRMHCEEEGTALPPLAQLPRPGPVSDEAVTQFLQPLIKAGDGDLATLVFPHRLAKDAGRRRELVRQVLRGCQLALLAPPGSPRCRFYLRAEPGLAALLLYSAARLLPEGLAAQLTFSTYEDAHRCLRLYRHAVVVNTYTPDTAKELDDEFFTARGYALDTFTQRCSPELRGDGESGMEAWVDLAGDGAWATIDKVHQLLGKNSTTLVSLREAVEAAQVSQRLAAGEVEPEELLTLRRSSLGAPILQQNRNQVWRVVRNKGVTDPRLHAEFSDVVREHVSELEEQVAAALRERPPGDWRPPWRLLWSALQQQPYRLRDVLPRLLPDPPFNPELRFGLLDELRRLPLTDSDQRAVLPLLGGCTVTELERFGQSDLPRNWFAHALCHGVLRSETRAFAIQHLHDADDALVHALWEHFHHLTDETQRRAILAPLFPPGEPQAAEFLGRLLRSGCVLRAETLEWLLDSLKVWKKQWVEFWSRDDHLGHLLEMLRALGDEAAGLWERLWGQIDEDVLLPGNSYQHLLLTNLAALRDRPGPALPASVLNAVNDWVALREHFEKASAIPDSKRQDIIAACNRRGLDPISPLRSYFVRFIAPQATRPEVVDDFTAFFQTFYLAGGERQHYSSRLIGWLRVVFGCGEVATRAVFQRYYVEKHIPAEFRWQLATEMHQAGLLLPSVYQATPKPTHEPGPEIIDGSIRAELDDEAFQLTGCRRAEGGERALLASVGQRGPWLATIVVIALATLLFYRLFPSKAQRFAELALFVPPLLLLVDAVAQQSVALAIRRYRLGSLRPRNLQRDTGWEVRIGLALGGGCGLALAVLALAWSGASVALCVWLTAFLGTALAAGAGFLVPTAQRRLPSLAWIAAGPSTRAAAAIITLLIYAAIARCLA